MDGKRKRQGLRFMTVAAPVWQPERRGEGEGKAGVLG